MKTKHSGEPLSTTLARIPSTHRTAQMGISSGTPVGETQNTLADPYGVERTGGSRVSNRHSAPVDRTRPGSRSH